MAAVGRGIAVVPPACDNGYSYCIVRCLPIPCWESLTTIAGTIVCLARHRIWQLQWTRLGAAALPAEAAQSGEAGAEEEQR